MKLFNYEKTDLVIVGATFSITCTILLLNADISALSGYIR